MQIMGDFLQNVQYHGGMRETDCVIHMGSDGGYMELKKLEYDLTVCKVASAEDIDFGKDFYFIGKTDEELSLVCKTEDTPENTVACDAGWKGFRVQGILDFSLIGILARISGILAENKISIFAVSTYNTDYILVKEDHFGKAVSVLEAAGYRII